MSSRDHHWPFLDLVRFAAALLVMLGHLRGLFFVSIQDVPQAGVATRAFYVLSGIHHEAVVLFFVVSGFLIGGRVRDQIAAGTFDPGRYLLDRFTRIYVVLLPALLLVGLIQLVGDAFLSDTRLFGLRPLPPAMIGAGWEWGQVPCHLAALPGIACAPWGANPPLWSLGFEWAFYLVAPLGLGLAYARVHGLARLAGAGVLLATLATLIPVGPIWLFWLAVWASGIVSSGLAQGRGLPLPLGLAGLALSGGAMVVARLGILPVVATDALVGIGLAAALAVPAIARFSLAERFVARGAAFSFSLYLIHLPVALLLGAMLERLAGWPPRLVAPEPSAYAVLALVCGAVLAISALFGRLTEDHTAAVRRRLRGAHARPVTAASDPAATPSRPLAAE